MIVQQIFLWYEMKLYASLARDPLLCRGPSCVNSMRSPLRLYVAPSSQFQNVIM
jgi:hypothetical protein